MNIYQICSYCSHTTIPRHTSQNSIDAGEMSEIKAEFFIRIQLLYPAILLHIR